MKFTGIHVSSFRGTELLNGREVTRVSQFPRSHNTAVNLNTGVFRQFVRLHIIPRLQSADLIEHYQAFLNAEDASCVSSLVAPASKEDVFKVQRNRASQHVPAVVGGVWQRE
jgi:hypothetical protein